MYTGASVYGMSPQAPTWGVAAPTAHLGTDDMAGGLRALFDPHNPLLWLGGILALTVGFAGVAGSARVGRFRVSASAGED
jgi:hypothetical protein